MILEQAPESAAAPSRKLLPVMPWVLSAKSTSALSDQAAQLARFLEQHSELDPHDVAYSLVTTRASFEHRAVVVGADRDEFLRGLAAISSSRPAPNVVTGRAIATGGNVFVFPGQGSQWTGMAVELLDFAPAFADQMRLCDAAFTEFVDWSLLDAVRGGVGSGSLDRVDVVQPVLFAVMVSLAAQWRALGVHPDAVLGHSQGEIAAAYVAGALSLRDAAKVVTLRSMAISAIAGTGGMVSISRPAEEVHALITPWAQALSIAAQYCPSSTVVTGDAAALDELMVACERDDLPVPDSVDYASHSADVEALRETLHESLGGLGRGPAKSSSFPRSPVPGWTRSCWTPTTGSPICGSRCYSNRLSGGRASTVIAPSSNPAASGTDRRRPGNTRGLRQRPQCGWDTSTQRRRNAAVLAVGCRGPRTREIPQLGKLVQRHRRVSHRITHLCLPTQALLDGSRAGISRREQSRRQRPEHPLLGAFVAQADSDETIFTGRLSLASHPWLVDHKVHGIVLLPGAAMVELALYAGDRVGCPRVDQLVLQAPLIVGERGDVAVQVIVGAQDESGERPVRIYSRIDRLGVDQAWTRHAGGILSPIPDVTLKEESAEWPPEGAEPIDVSEAYPKLALRGYEYGPAFRGLCSVWRRGAEVFVEAALPEAARDDASRFCLHRDRLTRSCTELPPAASSQNRT